MWYLCMCVWVYILLYISITCSVDIASPFINYKSRREQHNFSCISANAVSGTRRISSHVLCLVLCKNKQTHSDDHSRNFRKVFFKKVLKLYTTRNTGRHPCDIIKRWGTTYTGLVKSYGSVCMVLGLHFESVFRSLAKNRNFPEESRKTSRLV